METTVRGAGVLAAMGARLVCRPAGSAELWQLGQRFDPDMADSQRQKARRRLRSGRGPGTEPLNEFGVAA